MLVLTRHTDERILLTGGIEIVLLEARDGRAAIGIQAPAEIIIAREEVAGPDLKRKKPAEPPTTCSSK